MANNIYEPMVTIVAEPGSTTKTTVEKSKNHRKPPFDMAGKVGKMCGFEGYPLLDVMADMSVGEHWLFRLLRHNWEKDSCIAYLPNSSLTKSEQLKKNIAFKKLHDKDLVKRKKHNYYMINPAALINPVTFEDNWAIWKEMK